MSKAEQSAEPSRYRSERGYGGRSAEELREERRVRLLDAALTLFAENGYNNTTVDKICTEAHVSNRHFYEHFSDREAIMLAVYNDIYERMYKAITPVLMDESISPKERVPDAMRAFVDVYLTDARLAKVGSLQSVGISEEIEKVRKQVRHAFAQLIEGHARMMADANELPNRDYRLMAIALTSAAEGLIVESLVGDDPISAKKVKDTLVALLTTVIRGTRMAANDS